MGAFSSINCEHIVENYIQLAWRVDQKISVPQTPLNLPAELTTLL